MNFKLKELLRRRLRQNYAGNSKEVFTYLLYDGDYYKIGKSSQPDNRIHNLQTLNIRIIPVCYGLGVSEEFLHKRYAHRRVAGEWFELTKDEVGEIVAMICVPYKQFFLREGAADFKSALPAAFKVIDEENKKIDDFCKYTIGFGKYKGRLLCEMTSIDEVKYCKWYRGKLKVNSEYTKEWEMFDRWVGLLGTVEGSKILYDIQKPEWEEIRNSQ